MATIRERKPGVWEVRVFTGTDARGKPTQMSRTVRGTKRDAERLAASLEVGPGSASPAGRKFEDVFDEWIDQNIDTRAPASARSTSQTAPSLAELGRSQNARAGADMRGFVSPVLSGDDSNGYGSGASGGNALHRNHRPCGSASASSSESFRPR